MKTIIAIIAALALTGCATGQQYQAYAEAHKAQAAAQTARYQALADIARMGDTTAKVAAVISLQGAGQQQSQIATPRSAGDQALQWASVLVPAVSQAYMIGQNVKLGMRQSDNATALGVSTNGAFVGIAGKIQAPNVTTVTNTSTNTSTRTDNSVRTDSTHKPTVVPTNTTITSLTCTTGPC
jgi:hypothetical protein